jgi:hypothetical protein
MKIHSCIKSGLVMGSFRDSCKEIHETTMKNGDVAVSAKCMTNDGQYQYSELMIPAYDIKYVRLFNCNGNLDFSC